MSKEEIVELISKMTLQEKASLCSGEDFWHTKAVERLGIPASMVSDGPHGLRKQDDKTDCLGVNESIQAVCFPAGCALAASFDREVLRKVGETIGNECQAEDVSVILGPAVNIKRSPLCGRNFEYYSEDPYVATELAGAYIDGVQSQNVGTSIKHFFGNNQETRRMTSSSEIDERTIHEIYLAAFEGAVKNHKPWTIMSCYNKVNGTYVGENKNYLTDILRKEWGFEGYVVSDWGAMNNRVPDLAAGMDLEMPTSGGVSDRLIVKAVEDGTLEESVLDTAVLRILTIVYRYIENRNKEAMFDFEKDHQIACDIAKETIVLLKNEGILPLKEDKKVAIIGAFAKKPRYQGGGSSHINSFKTVSALEALDGVENISYAEGFGLDGEEVDQELEEEAVRTASKADVAVVFAGLPDSFESEGFDRHHMRMPECQNHLIEAITKVQPNVVVVLHNGSPIEMPWIGKVKGLVECYLGGEGIGTSVCDVLYGRANPSGRLPETFPLHLSDNPSYLSYIGEGDKVEYREGIFVGYRYYDKKEKEVLFPFGYGLSYTTFFYSNMKVDKEKMSDTDTVQVSVDVTNTGDVEGKEVVQLYVGKRDSNVIRPIKELRGFEKVSLKPLETKKVTFTLSMRAFAYYETKIHDWYVEDGIYDIMIAKSVNDVQYLKQIELKSTVSLPQHVTMDTAIIDLLGCDGIERIIEEELGISDIYQIMRVEEESVTAAEAFSKESERAMLEYLPLRGIVSFTGGAITLDKIQNMIDRINNQDKVFIS